MPSTQLGRALGFARLGLGLMGTVAAHTATRAWNGPSDEERAAAEAQSAATSPPPTPLIDSAYLSEASAEALAAGLCRMRGSALKLGQMLSMQGDEVLPPQVARALARVRAGADTMPAHQLRAQLDAQLGEDWQERLVDFQDKPIAAASIGQVHRARLPPPLAERYGFEDVALKVRTRARVQREGVGVWGRWPASCTCAFAYMRTSVHLVRGPDAIRARAGAIPGSGREYRLRCG